mmetsp:Transcript_1470/g.6423  ORF Transcript_1470/g.6423 Transcript_1470/m.6423 type:complete len:208 (-) Transcript_1470:1223-1846(-)
MAHEARYRPCDAPERRYPAHGRADQPLGRHERRVGEELPAVPQGRDVDPRVARLRPPDRRVHAHHGVQEPEAAPLQGQPHRVRAHPPGGPRLLRVQGNPPEVHLPPADLHRRCPLAQLAADARHRRIAGLPGQHAAYHRARHRERQPCVARGLHRPERSRKVDPDQGAHRRGGADHRLGVAPPRRPYRIHRAARFPPHRAALEQDAK